MWRSALRSTSPVVYTAPATHASASPAATSLCANSRADPVSFWMERSPACATASAVAGPSTTSIGTAMPLFAISLAAEMIRSSPLSGNTIRQWSAVARRRICSTNVTSVARFRRVDSSLTEAGRSVFGPDRPVLELLRQRFCHSRMDETVQISTVLSHLAHDTRADVRGFDRRDHEHRLEILGHMPVH